MSRCELSLLWLRDPRLAPLAIGALPAWLWSMDATHVLWANPAGAALLGTADPAALALRRFDGRHPAAAQVARTTETLPASGAPKLYRLRGLAEFGRALACICTRLVLADGTAAILVTSCEPAGPDLPLPEQLRRLLADCTDPVAAFAPDGTLLHATPAALARLGGTGTLAAAAQALATTAAEPGILAETAASLGLVRVGGDATTALIAILPSLPGSAQHGSDASAADAADAGPVDATPAVPPQPAIEPAPGTSTAAATEPVATMAPSQAATEWRHPLRFVWQVDSEGRFTLTSDEFIALIGPRTAAALGRPWEAIAEELGLDAEGQFARAVATQDTWSSLTVAWPVDGSSERLVTELSGLPVFDRERTFRGYRGFGVCRDVARLTALSDWRRNGSDPGPVQPPAAQPEPKPDIAENSEPSKTESDDMPASAPAAGNVVPFPSAGEASRPSLNPVERRAFRELAQRLAKGLAANGGGPISRTVSELTEATEFEDDGASAEDEANAFAPAAAAPVEEQVAVSQTDVLDQLPHGVLVYRLSQLLYANRAFLDWAGFDDIAELDDAGGLDAVFIEPDPVAARAGSAASFTVTSRRAERRPASAQLLTVTWDGDSAFALVAEVAPAAAKAPDRALAEAQRDIAELTAVLDIAADAVIVLDAAGRILSANRGAQALFGYEGDELAGRPLADLFAEESEPVALAYLDGLVRDGVASLINDGREVVGRVRQGGLIPLFMTIGRLGEGSDKFCAVVRDLTAWKKSEEDLGEARRQADKASSVNSDRLAMLGREIRTPLNTIIGFSDVMMQERFGPIGNQRYQQYVKDIHTSAGHLLGLVNEFVDLTRIEAGQIELTFAGLSLNDLTQQCVAVMQPQANRERIIIRTSLPPKLPQVIADERSVRQIVLSLLSNSIGLAGPGGQVIVSTALAERGDVVLRVRDTGPGLNEQELGTVTDPFRHPLPAERHADGPGLGLPLAKALAEANRASFAVKSTPNVGTLVELSFPAARVLAE